jgi:hypothetical protein
VVVVTERRSVGRVIGNVMVGRSVELELVVVIEVLELLDDVAVVDVVHVVVVAVLLVVGASVVLVLGARVVEEEELDEVLVDELVLVLVDVVVGPPASRAGAHRTFRESTVSERDPNWSWTSIA